ncbi:hypothetical protein STEG23_003182, partial [Scotinomys teguina]
TLELANDGSKSDERDCQNQCLDEYPEIILHTRNNKNARIKIDKLNVYCSTDVKKHNDHINKVTIIYIVLSSTTVYYALSSMAHYDSLKAFNCLPYPVSKYSHHMNKQHDQNCHRNTMPPGTNFYFSHCSIAVKRHLNQDPGVNFQLPFENQE